MRGKRRVIKSRFLLNLHLIGLAGGAMFSNKTQYEDISDHRSYEHNISSGEIKA